MRGLIQRVSTAKVIVQDVTVGEIGQGLLLLLGVDKGDSEVQANKLVKKVLSYRVFPDHQEKMNLCLSDINGGLLIVSQFTLSADTAKGLRPSFSSAAPPVEAERLYNYFIAHAQKECNSVACGIFGADMKVHLINDGPVTFLLEA